MARSQLAKEKAVAGKIGSALQRAFGGRTPPGPGVETAMESALKPGVAPPSARGTVRGRPVPAQIPDDAPAVESAVESALRQSEPPPQARGGVRTRPLPPQIPEESPLVEPAFASSLRLPGSIPLARGGVRTRPPGMPMPSGGPTLQSSPPLANYAPQPLPGLPISHPQSPFAVQLTDLLEQARARAPGEMPGNVWGDAEIAQGMHLPEPNLEELLRRSLAAGERKAPTPGIGRTLADSAVARVARAYAKAGQSVDGLSVGTTVKNTGSISASFDEGAYRELPGIREVPLANFQSSPRDMFYAKNDLDRVQSLAEQIRHSGRIDPLIVAVDEQGPYVLEGGHRLAALHMLGKKSFPAVVIEESGARYPTSHVFTSNPPPHR